MLEVKDLNVGYGQSHVIHDATFSAAKAEILVIMGRNGMGKTTLFKSLIGMIGSKSGSVKVDGVEVTGLSPHKRVRQRHGLRSARANDLQHTHGFREPDLRRERCGGEVLAR
jgi:ABC-type branched-subunit amino acid transport system ATPase component